MRILLVPDGTGAKPHRCLNHRHVVAVSIVLGLLLCAVSVYGTYRLTATRAPVTVIAPPAPIDPALKEMLAAQQRAIQGVRQRIENHLDVLGQRVGRMQAQVTRINAVGERLTEMAELDAGEFGFGEEPAVGGPEPNTVPAATAEKDLISALDALEQELGERERKLDILAALLADRELHASQMPAGWPLVGGWVSSRFGYRNDPFTGRRAFHEGVDIAGKSDATIKAVAAGVVTFAGERPGFGRVVEINHGNGYSTRYAHALAVMVDTGERVEKGQVIAIIGSSGRSTGPHLHFEVLRDDRPVNPREYLRANG